MTRSLLDTDIFSEVMKGRNANVVQAARGYLATHEQLTISAVTVMEVSYGLRRAGRTEQLAAFEAMLANIEVLPLGDAAGLLAGHMKADLDARGTPIGASDVMIAAVAITSGIPLVTGNVSHFEFVRAAGHALTIENWRA